MNCAKLSLVVLAVAVLAPTYVSAGVVHKWHDAEGVMQFSDTPPASDDFHVSTIEFNAEEPRDGREADYYSIINQWQRLKRGTAGERTVKIAEGPAACGGAIDPVVNDKPLGRAPSTPRLSVPRGALSFPSIRLSASKFDRRRSLRTPDATQRRAT